MKRKHMTCVSVIFVLALLICGFAIAKGSAVITLDGGSKGNIEFPHHRHHNVISDCMTCHKRFEQKPGSIAEAKQTGKYKKMQVMNKLCIACHRTEKKAGNKSGPISCSGCHVK